MMKGWEKHHDGSLRARVGVFELTAWESCDPADRGAWCASVTTDGMLDDINWCGVYPTPDAAKAAAIALLRRICGDALHDVRGLEAGDA